MKLVMSSMPIEGSIWNPEPEPDVWWGEGGIDALLWANPRPLYQEAAQVVSEDAVLAHVGGAA